MMPWTHNRHFEDEPLQAIDCTGTDSPKQANKTLHTPETQKRNSKTKQTKASFQTSLTNSGQKVKWTRLI